MATAANVFRDYETDGVPSSGAKKPKKSEIRQLLGGYEAILRAGLDGDGFIYETKAILDSSLAPLPNSKAWVVLDPVAANNGIYQKFGVSGTGYWERRADLPYSFIVASDVGAGTANAIQATTSMPVSPSALVLLNIFEPNTGSPVTVSFNGGAALTIKTNSGNDIAVGGLPSGMIVLGVASGATFRLVNDQVSSAVVAAAEAAAAAAEASADEAAATVAGKANLVGGNVFEGEQSFNTPRMRAQGGNEGGEIVFEKPASSTTLEADVKVDLYEDQLRVLESGGAVRGAFIDFTKLSPGVTNEFLFGSTIGANTQAKMAFFGWIRDNTHAALMQWVTDPSATDWAPYFNQCLADVNTASGGRGGRILLPCRDMPLSKIAPFTYNGIALEGTYRPYWEGEAFGSRIIALAGSDDLITVGNMSTETEGFTVEKVRIDCGFRTGGVIYKANRVRMFNIVDSSHHHPVNFAEVRGGIDIYFEKVHCEAYRGIGLNVIGDVARVDRLRLNDFKCSGSGTESSITNTGPALAVSGQVETIDTNLLQLVKVFQGVKMIAAGGNKPRFVTMQNTQVDYCKNELFDIEDVYDFKSSQLYNNTSLDSAGLVFGAGARRVTLTQSGLSGAKNSAIGFAGKGLTLHDFSFQDWNTGGTGAPCIDLVSGFDRAKILACTVGKWGDEANSGGGAGTRAVRINAGTGRVFMDQTELASDLDFSGAAPGTSAIQNNGSGAVTLGTNPTN